MLRLMTLFRLSFANNSSVFLNPRRTSSISTLKFVPQKEQTTSLFASSPAIVAWSFFSHFGHGIESGRLRFNMAYFFFHRALAAFADIWERLRALNLAARALPPLSPPRRPRATAAGFLDFSGGGSNLGACPVDSSMIW